MNLRLSLIAILAATCVGGVVLYKNPQLKLEKKVYIYAAKTPGTKEDIGFIRRALQLYDIKHDQIIENPKQTSTDQCIKIFFEQDKFEQCLLQNDAALKIAIRLNDSSEQEDSKIVGVFNEDKTESLLELVEAVIKQPINCLLIFDAGAETLNRTLAEFQELAKIKGIELQLCALAANQNIATVLKQEAKNVNAVIIIAGPLALAESELIFEHFNAHKIPVFTNHAGLIRSGALGGFDFDTQEIAHGIAELSSSFFKDSANISSDGLEELYPQLHLNMDTIAKLGVQLEPDLLDEAVTVGGADL